MAKLSALPSQAIISSLAGQVDFYLWKGIPVARKYPTYPPRKPYPDESFNQQEFAYINHWTTWWSSLLKDIWRSLTKGTQYTWKDLAVRAYMSGIT